MTSLSRARDLAKMDFDIVARTRLFLKYVIPTVTHCTFASTISSAIGIFDPRSATQLETFGRRKAAVAPKDCPFAVPAGPRDWFLPTRHFRGGLSHIPHSGLRYFLPRIFPYTPLPRGTPSFPFPLFPTN